MSYFNITSRQKIYLLIGFGLVGLITIFVLFILIPYYELRDIQSQYEMSNNLIKKYYQNFSRLQKIKNEYLLREQKLEEVKSRLFVKGTPTLNILTRKSPVKKFSYYSLKKQEKKEFSTGIYEYPFKIKFKSGFQTLGRYLLHQETSLPISLVKKIEITPVKGTANTLETKLEGNLYTVDHL